MKVQYLLSSQQMHAISSLAHIDGKNLVSDIVSDKHLVEYDITEDQIFMLDSLLNMKGVIVKDKKSQPSDGDKYYCIEDDGNIFSSIWNNDQIDKKRMDIKNVFKTKEEAEFACERLKVLNRLKELSDDDQEWNNINRHYLFAYNTFDDGFDIWSYRNIKVPHEYWFKSKESAGAAIKTIGKDKLKKYVFNVKE